MQVYGSAIVVGYQAKPDIASEKDFDASQSNSGVEYFEESEYKKNLVNLGFNGQVTYMEQFDPNDVEDPKIPMEFKKYPVDVLSDIHVKYEDQYYDRFIETAEEIFKKYNEDMECNPDNDLLYYETDECDSKLNDEHGHGGYICGEDGQWDTDNCVLKYCDVGYILDIQNKKCIEDPCENIEIIVIESQNGGGSASLCFPMTQYFRPKTLGTVLTATKETDLNYECLSTKDENLNNETCKAYDSREKLYRGTVDDYGNGVIHNRTKGIELYSIYSKKEM